MNKNDLEKYVGTENLTLIEAMQKIDQNAKGIIYIVDDKGHLKGSLTDGDIRRWILKTGSVTGTVSQMYYKHTKYLFEMNAQNSRKYLDEEAIRSLPIVNNELELLDIYFKDEEREGDEINNKGLIMTPIIIMAGGKGTRLYPYTKILPKPLIPIGDIPILERIIMQFSKFGAKQFYITVNYKKEMIKSYFTEMRHEYILHYIEEDIPLGTAGSIRLIEEKFPRPVIITNCDTLIEADYEEIIKYHESSKNDMTIITCLKNTTIPYGVLHSKEQGLIISIEEKPKLSYFINTGMYIVSPDYLEWIPEKQIFHMTDLAEKMMSQGKRVGMYPINESAFLDMGEFEELKKMEERINGGFTE